MPRNTVDTSSVAKMASQPVWGRQQQSELSSCMSRGRRERRVTSAEDAAGQLAALGLAFEARKPAASIRSWLGAAWTARVQERRVQEDARSAAGTAAQGAGGGEGVRRGGVVATTATATGAAMANAERAAASACADRGAAALARAGLKAIAAKADEAGHDAAAKKEGIEARPTATHVVSRMCASLPRAVRGALGLWTRVLKAAAQSARRRPPVSALPVSQRLNAQKAEVLVVVLVAGGALVTAPGGDEYVGRAGPAG